MGLKLVTAPTSQPITLAQAKQQCRATEFTDDDELIGLFIDAAVDFADGPSGFLGRALIDQTWDYYLDAFPASGPIEIPLPPLIEVIGLFYQDGDGIEQEWMSTNYVVDSSGNPGKVSLGSGVSWPTPIVQSEAVRIRFRAGYIVDPGDSPIVENVPGAIKAALLIHVADLYANRESSIVGQTVAKLPWSAEQLLRRYRFYLGMA